MDRAWRCVAVAVGDVGFTCCKMVLIGRHQRLGRSNLLLPVRLVIEDHVTGCTPQVCADRSQGHVRRAQLAKLISRCQQRGEDLTYLLLAVQFEILLRRHCVLLRFFRVGRIDALGDIGKNLLGSEHAVGIQSGAVVAIPVDWRSAIGSRAVSPVSVLSVFGDVW